MTLSYPVWTPPTPAPAEAPRPALWSARRTTLAIVAAVGIGSLTAVTVSYADTGSSSTGTFQRPGGGQFNGGPFGRRGNGQSGNGPFGNGQFGNGQFGNGQQGGPLQGGQLAPAPNGLPGGQ